MSSRKVEKLSWGRQNWFEYWKAEHEAARNDVILMDMSFMSKFLVQGRDAGRMLTNCRPTTSTVEPGTITYTQWLNDAGKLEADLTVTKLDEDRFWVVATDTAHRHVETRMRRHFERLPRHRHRCHRRLRAAERAGPAFARAAAVVDHGRPVERGLPVPHGALHRHRLRPGACASASPTSASWATSCTCPAEQAVHVYDRIVAAGAAFGLRHAGLKALGSLRMEKGYRDYGHDIDNTDSVLEAGLGFAVDLDKPDGFIGRDAVVAQKAAGPLTRRLVQVLVDDPEPLMFHAEVVHRDDRPGRATCAPRRTVSRSAARSAW